MTNLDHSQRCPDCGTVSKIEICQSAAGYYIGSWCSQCNYGPHSRLSGYYFDKTEVDEAFRELYFRD